MKRILAVLLLVMLLALSTALAEDESGYYFYIAEPGVAISISSSWLEAAQDGNIMYYSDISRDEDGNIEACEISLVFMSDPSLTAGVEDGAQAGEIFDEHGVYLAKIFVVPVSLGEAAVTSRWPDLSFIDHLGDEGGYSYFIWTDETPDSNVDDIIYKDIIRNVMISLAAPYSSIELLGPEIVEALLGDFEATDIYGEAVTPEIFAGVTLTMVNIWGTYCGPCINEMPDLGEINEEYGERGFQIVGLLSDVYSSDEASTELAREIVEQTGAGYTHIVPDAVIYESVISVLMYVPETFFVDSDGNQVGQSYVGSRSKAEWVSIIEALLEDM